MNRALKILTKFLTVLNFQDDNWMPFAETCNMMRSCDNIVAYYCYKRPGDGSERSQIEKSRQRYFYLDFQHIMLM